MSLKAAMWVHGTAAQVENPNSLIPNGLVRVGAGTQFNGQSGAATWFHFAIPTPVILNDVRLSLVKIFLLYNTNQKSSTITNVHVWDGGVRLRAFDNLMLRGDHRFGIDKDNSWEITPHIPVTFGIEIAARVQFMDLIDGPEPGAKQFEFGFFVSTAGADFEG